MSRRAVLAGTAAIASVGRRARAQTGAPIRFGVLADETGPYAASSGPGASLAARMAVADFGPSVIGLPIEVLHADTQNKPDVASTIARRWFDQDGVDAITDLPVTPVAIAVQQVAREKTRSVMITGAAVTEFTTKFCAPISSHWTDDNNALAVGTGGAVIANGGKSWFFITVDIAFGKALQAQTTDIVDKAGGKVVGSTTFPIGTTDFSALLVQAQNAGAEVIGLVAVGGELVNLVKQAGEFGLGASGKTLAGFLVYITDIHALGLNVAAGLTYTSGFYWDMNPGAHAWSERYFQTAKAMPSKEQAYVYVSVLHYLKAIAQAGTRDPLAVNKAMRAMPVDYFGTPASLRSDGRFMHDLTLYRVKKPSESHGPWDYLQEVRTIPAGEAFLPEMASCKLS
ncbi:MAG: ABC transporter substrate-binding protein [Acetobacteraceae bacterium]|nr:ABC transporter substrate-binding protein [Acetobacteraceae bacterium]